MNYIMITNIQKKNIGDCEHAIKVWKVVDGYEVTIYTDFEINQVAKVTNADYILDTITDMLRWEVKSGNHSFITDNKKGLT